jgi:2-keto-3-deoxy-6-phosphogluconate aldolase
VNQTTATGYIRAGAAALGIRGELIPPEAVQRRDRNWIHELTGRFLAIVQRARAEFGSL